VSNGFSIANSKFVVIFCYAIIAATVGIILRIVQERVGFIGSIITGLIGVAWTLATSMVVPVLVPQHNIGPIEAVQESAALLKKTWGENIIGNVGIGFAFGVIGLFIALASALLFFGTRHLVSVHFRFGGFAGHYGIRFTGPRAGCTFGHLCSSLVSLCGIRRKCAGF
jgi:hypothetical protein